MLNSLQVKKKSIYFVLTKTNNKMENLSIETKTQAAIQMVIMDAIEKGHTNSAELISYMKSEVFGKAVKNYVELFNQN